MGIALILQFLNAQGLQALATRFTMLSLLVEGTSIANSLFYSFLKDPAKIIQEIVKDKNKEYMIQNLIKKEPSLRLDKDPSLILDALLDRWTPNLSNKYKEYSSTLKKEYKHSVEDIKDLVELSGITNIKDNLKKMKNPIELTEEVFEDLEEKTKFIGVTVNLVPLSTAAASGRFISIYEQQSGVFGVLLLSFQGKSPSSGKYYAYPNVSLDTWVEMVTKGKKGNPGDGAYGIFVSEYLSGGLGKKERGSFYRNKSRQLSRKIEVTKDGNYKTRSIISVQNRGIAESYIKRYSNYKKPQPTKKMKKAK